MNNDGDAQTFRDGPGDRAGRPGKIRDLWRFVRHSGKWWLLPILIALVIVGLCVAFGGSVFAPLLYPLF